jgi:tripartite-type tricarboxylate transporter receptor subunit TctC
LREAFAQMFKDPEFVEDLKKRNWEVEPVGGEELQNLAKEVVNQPADVAAALKRIQSQ